MAVVPVLQRTRRLPAGRLACPLDNFLTRTPTSGRFTGILACEAGLIALFPPHEVYDLKHDGTM